MGLFGRNKEEKREEKISLAELPKLPEINSSMRMDKIHQLPTFPSNSFGKKFSQNSIKEAVTGRRGEEVLDADDFDENAERMMQEPLTKPRIRELDEEIEEEEILEEPPKISQRRIAIETEPIFIQIEKFEESMNVFDQAKKEIMNIEHLLTNIKTLKEKEEKELQEWAGKIRTIKTKIEKIDRDIFSKI